ncbi:MAG: Coenzyme F420 hydrogenase/dehydrogenase, beta subunit C-terminal domain [Methanobacterium sp.]
MVGTPCQILAASKMDKYMDGEFPVDIKIGLFCMENFSYSYMKELLKGHEIDIKDVRECRIEKGHAWFYLTEDRVFKIPLKEAKKCVRKNCQVCMDFTSENSDISVGSVGSPEGWSTVIVRTDKGNQILTSAEAEGHLETKPMTDSGLKIMEKLAMEKKDENKAEIKKREDIGRPVLYRRMMPGTLFEDEVNGCQFTDLKCDIIDIGTCVLCGACTFACPEGIIEINDRKPQIKGECPEGCNLCYVACPRTYVPDDLASKKTDKIPFGNYIKIVSAKAPMVKGQDGGVATALLSYILSKNITDEVLVVDKKGSIPWKPKSKLTNNIADIIKASGTKYSVCPIFTSLKDSENPKIKGGN